jgi:hypothetical protein
MLLGVDGDVRRSDRGVLGRRGDLRRDGSPRRSNRPRGAVNGAGISRASAAAEALGTAGVRFATSCRQIRADCARWRRSRRGRRSVPTTDAGHERMGRAHHGRGVSAAGGSGTRAETVRQVGFKQRCVPAGCPPCAGPGSEAEDVVQEAFARAVVRLAGALGTEGQGRAPSAPYNVRTICDLLGMDVVGRSRRIVPAREGYR